MKTYNSIIAARCGAVLNITLDRPQRLNAASLEMANELSAALYNLGDARCVLITGNGKGFCSGADLATSGEQNVFDGRGGAHLALQNHYNPLISQILRCPVPVVTAVNGPAAGVGCSIALAADFVLAGKSGYFLQAFVNIGLVPDGGSTWLLARAVGRARATRMMMLGEKIGAAQAEEWGLIYRAVEDAALMEEATALATQLAQGPTLAYATMKNNIMTALDGTLPQVLLAEAEGQHTTGASVDAMEGGAAFIEKRRPQFVGS